MVPRDPRPTRRVSMSQPIGRAPASWRSPTTPAARDASHSRDRRSRYGHDTVRRNRHGTLYTRHDRQRWPCVDFADRQRYLGGSSVGRGRSEWRSILRQHDRKNPPNALLNPYQTADGRWILLVAAQRKDWPAFARAIGMPELLEDPRFVDDQRIHHAAALVEILDPLFAGRPLAFWKQVLNGARVIFGVVQIAEEIIHDPQLEANGRSEE